MTEGKIGANPLDAAGSRSVLAELAPGFGA